MMDMIGTARGGRFILAITATVILSAILVRGAEAHPLHTTLAQMSYDPVTLQLDASIRVFTSDLALAVAKRSGSTRPIDNAAAFAYLAATFQLADASGRVIAWTSCGTREEGDVTFLCVRAAKVPSSARVSDQMLCDLFDDQVNIVQTRRGREEDEQPVHQRRRAEGGALTVVRAMNQWCGSHRVALYSRATHRRVPRQCGSSS